MSFRLRPWQRLRRKADFNRPRSEGLTFHHREYLCRIMPSLSTEAKVSRLGVVASKRTGKAHERNRSKRLLREVFRKNQALVPAGQDVLFIARREILGSDCEQLESHFRTDCARASKLLAR